MKLPVVDAEGYPIQKRGVTEYDGLYLLGMPWLHRRKSGILFGVGEDAACLAHTLRNERRSASRLACSSKASRKLPRPAVGEKCFLTSLFIELIDPL